METEAPAKRPRGAEAPTGDASGTLGERQPPASAVLQPGSSPAASTTIEKQSSQAASLFWLPKSNQQWETDPEAARPPKKATAAPAPAARAKGGLHSNMTSWTGATQSSCYRGVSWSKSMKKWQAYIMTGGKNNTIGYFESEEEAARIRDERARKQDGALATFNFPREGELGLLKDAAAQQKQDHRIRSVKQAVEALIQRIELDHSPKDEHGSLLGLLDSTYAGVPGGDRSRRTRRKPQNYAPHSESEAEQAAAAKLAAGPPKWQREWLPLWARGMLGTHPPPPKNAEAGKDDAAGSGAKCHWRKFGGQWVLSKYGGTRQHIGTDGNLNAAGRAYGEASQRLSKKGSVRQRVKPKAERTRQDEADEDAAAELTDLLLHARNVAAAHPSAAPGQMLEVEEEWVQCDLPSCAKWRKLPAHIKAGDLPQRFICSMITWGDRSLARCDAPEESATATTAVASAPAPAPPPAPAKSSSRGKRGSGRKSAATAGERRAAATQLCEDCGIRNIDLRRRGRCCSECGQRRSAEQQPQKESVAMGRLVASPETSAPAAANQAAATAPSEDQVKAEMDKWHLQQQQAYEAAQQAQTQAHLIQQQQQQQQRRNMPATDANSRLVAAVVARNPGPGQPTGAFPYNP